MQGVFEVGEQVKCLVMGLDPGYTNISLSVAGQCCLWQTLCLGRTLRGCSAQCALGGGVLSEKPAPR